MDNTNSINDLKKCGTCEVSQPSTYYKPIKIFDKEGNIIHKRGKVCKICRNPSIKTKVTVAELDKSMAKIIEEGGFVDTSINDLRLEFKSQIKILESQNKDLENQIRDLRTIIHELNNNV